VMLPAIMPLLQQMLTQTLAASTVNVKVESATTILPIEISASTVIVPIEIKASSVTLNVNITNTSLNVNATIVDSNVTLNVNIKNTKLDVNITNATLNVNITNQVVQTANPKPCLSFDGVDDYVEVPASSSWKPSSLTAEIWVYPYAWVSQATSNPSHHFYPIGDGFGIASSSSYWIYWINTSNGRQTRSVSHGNQLNMWHQVVLTYNQDTGDMKFYVDGVLKDTYNLGAGTAIAWGSGALRISHPPNYAIYGRIMCARIYNRALSDSEIQRNYQNPESPVTRGLVLWLKMDEGVGTKVYDYSGNGNNGTIYGATWVSSVGSAPATINVNITGSNVTFNVKITGADVRVGIEIQAQTVDVQLTETYWTMRGYDKVLSGWDFVTPVGGVYHDYVIEYTVQPGKRLVVYAVDITLEMIRYASSDEIASRYPVAGWFPTMYTYGDDVEVELRKGDKGDTLLATFECRPTNPHMRYEFKVPKIYNAGDVLRVWAHAKLGYSFVRVTVYGVELAA